MPNEKNITLKDIMEFFGIPMNKFRSEWNQLTKEDKEQIRQGLVDSTYTY